MANTNFQKQNQCFLPIDHIEICLFVQFERWKTSKPHICYVVAISCHLVASICHLFKLPFYRKIPDRLLLADRGIYSSIRDNITDYSANQSKKIAFIASQSYVEKICLSDSTSIIMWVRGCLWARSFHRCRVRNSWC